MTNIIDNGKIINAFDMFDKNPHIFAETIQHHIISWVSQFNYKLFNSNEYKHAKIVFMERNLKSKYVNNCSNATPTIFSRN